MSPTSFDFSELEKLTADLGTVPPAAARNLLKAMGVTANRVKADARATVGTSRHGGLRRAASYINYDINTAAGIFAGSLIEAEIGYDRRKAGKLGNIREFGIAGRTAGHRDLSEAAHRNESDFVRGLSIALEDAEKQAGL